jgi:hypothetical protein
MRLVRYKVVGAHKRELGSVTCENLPDLGRTSANTSVRGPTPHRKIRFGIIPGLYCRQIKRDLFLILFNHTLPFPPFPFCLVFVFYHGSYIERMGTKTIEET